MADATTTAPTVGGAPVTDTTPALTEAQVPKETAGKLANIFAAASDDYVTPEAQDALEKSSKGAEKPDKPAEEKLVVETKEEEKPVGEVKPTEGDQSSTSAPTGPVLPAAYRRTLKAYEYTDEEIDAALKAGGEQFIAVASKMHQTRNKELAQWAEIGRRNKAQQKPSTPAAQQQQAEPAGLKPLDLAALEAKYGKDEPLIQQLIPVNQAIAELNRALPIVRQYQEQSAKAAQEQLAQQVQGFFAAEGMKEYRDQYGTDLSKLSPEQYEARTKVLELADALIAGSRVQGRNLTVDEALQLAHDSTASDTKTQVVRQQIASDLQKRQAGMTLKPQARASTPTKGGAKDDKELRANVKAGLKKAWG